jgi:ABC-type lipoprotein release transport system permease subunit
MAIMTTSQARENFFAAIATLRSAKVRSALTILGIVIGVSSVISMAAIIQGLNKFVQDKVESLGSRTYFVSRFPPGSDPSRWPESIRTRMYFEYNYADFIRDAAPHVQIITTVGTRGFFFGDSTMINYEGRSVERVILRGAEPEYTDAIPLSQSNTGASSVLSIRNTPALSLSWVRPSANRCSRTKIPLVKPCALTANSSKSLACSSTTPACLSAPGSMHLPSSP